METERPEVLQTRQRASIKWLLSKAFNNAVPENLKEPFYRDQNNQERLKPQIIVELGNATLYCQTLTNLYSDPNYQSLNHWSILQTLARKGVPVQEPTDMPINETVLIQTNPLKIKAHMFIIESLMILYSKEITSGERIANAIRRVTGSDYVLPKGSPEKILWSWVLNVCSAMKKRISGELEKAADENSFLADISKAQDIQELHTGISMALLVSYYCPKLLPWENIKISSKPTADDSKHNLQLIYSFCQKNLPYNVFCLTPEEIVRMKSALNLNLILLLADLFNLFEINPAKCVNFPGMDTQASSGVVSRKSTPPLEYRHIDGNSTENYRSEAFVVHRSRGITTLSSINSPLQNQEPLMPARMRQNKETTNALSKAEERGEFAPAGRPSNWEQNRRPSYAGRRSRRNSSSEDSQLTIENFGGSQDQLNMFGQIEREREQRYTNARIEPAVAIRSSKADARGTLQIGYDTDSGSEKQDFETEKFKSETKRTEIDNANKSTPKQHSIEKTQHNDIFKDNTMVTPENSEKTPLTRTMSNKSAHSPLWQNTQPSADLYEEEAKSLENENKLSTIRMKLEERRRRIEDDKRQIELALLRHQDKICEEEYRSVNNQSRNPEIDPIEMDKYQQSIAVMNLNLQDIQQDIQRLVNQHNQIQAQHLQVQLIKTQQGGVILHQQPNFGSQQHLADHFQQRSMPPQMNFGSTPHLAQVFNQPAKPQSRPSSRDPYQQMHYINEHGQYVSPMSQQPILHQPNYMVPPPNMYPENTLIGGSHNYMGAPFIPHHNQHAQHYIKRQSTYDDYIHPNNFSEPSIIPQSNQVIYAEPMQQLPVQRNSWAQMPYEQNQLMGDAYSHMQKQPPYNMSNQQNFVVHQNGGSGRDDYHHYQVMSPQHAQQPQRISRHEDYNNDEPYRSNMPETRAANNHRSTDLSTFQPTDDVMAPQSICFIGDEEDVDEIESNIIESMKGTHLSELAFMQDERQKEQDTLSELYGSSDGLPQKLSITSGNLTYRIPSPNRTLVHPNVFQDTRDNVENEKGFYISFDDDNPKRPKPPLRSKNSPKKNRSIDKTDHRVIKRESMNMDYHRNDDQNNIYENAENNNGIHNNKATYNKYTDSPFNLNQFQADEVKNNDVFDRLHLKDVSNEQSLAKSPTSPTSPLSLSHARLQSEQNLTSKGKALIIGDDATVLDPDSVDEMERRKERILLMSLQRRQQQEEAKARKEIEALQKREKEREKEEERARKKEEQMARRAAILQQHRLKKTLEEAEREGKTIDRADLVLLKQHSQIAATPRPRQQRPTRPRPKTIHVDDASVDISEASSLSSRGKKGSSSNLTDYSQLNLNTLRRNCYRGSQDSLSVKESPDDNFSTSSTPIGRRGSQKLSRESTFERGRSMSRLWANKGSTLNLRDRKSNSLVNLCDSGLGRATPPRRAPSPGMHSSGRHMPSPSGPGSLPPGLITKRRGFDDGLSDLGFHTLADYSGPKLYKQPTAKSNRSIILNAVEYCVFPGAVNREAKQKVLEKIALSEAKHFLVLFRDVGCQFRALYSYVPETNHISKLYGTGPSQVDEVMFDKFFKYNSGGKCFSQVHTKHLTVTIDAFTIHNSLWQGKRVQLPSKKDMALVI